MSPATRALPLTVGVLGAGVAGLATATALLRRAGVADVTVYERDSTEVLPTRAGHGLLLMQNGVRALEALGAAHVLDGYRPLTAAVLQTDAGVVARSELLEDVYCVTRAGIVEGLRKDLPAGCIRYGRGVTRVTLAPQRAGHGPRIGAVTFADGDAVLCRPPDGPAPAGALDLLIGAEGYRSRVWSALNPGVERTESRVMEVVTSTELPELASLLGSRFIKTLFPSRGLAFGLLSPTPTRVIGFLQFDSHRHAPPADRSGPGFARFVRALLADAPEPVRTYLDRADFSTAHLWRPINADLPTHLTCENAALVGDAAHPLLPFTSQGVSAALEDAVMLADALSAVGPDLAALPGALRGFAHDRRADLGPYVDGGRQILANFVEPSAIPTAPYVDGAMSRLDEHLSLPRGGLLDLVRVLDVNGDGDLDAAEFGRLLAILGFDVTADTRDALLAEIDHDGNGLLSYAEVALALGGTGPASEALVALRRRVSPRSVGRGALEGRAHNLLRQLDSDGDGRVTAAELGSALLLLGVAADRAEADRAFARLDADGDGAVTVDDIVATYLERPRAPAPARPDEPDPLFSDAAVDRAVLRERAFNFRWATLDADVIPLTAADPDFPVAAVITDAVRRYLAPGYLSYGPAEGLPLLRDVASAHLTATRGFDAPAGRVFVTDSAASALFLTAALAIERPGDEVIIPDPVDFLLERSVVAAGGVVKRFRLRAEDGYAPDPEAIEALVTPRTRMLSICNPHNPLGRVWTRAELEAMTAIAVRHDLRIMSDEVWAEIVHAPSAHTATAAVSEEVARRTMSVFGFSKGYGLAGLRIGLLVSPDDATHRRLVALAHAPDTAYGVSTVSQVAAAAAYTDAGPWLARYVAHLTRQRDHLVARLNALDGVRCHVPEGTFVVFPDVSALVGAQVEPLVGHLRDVARVAVVPGSPAFFGPGAAGHIRLAYATSRRILDEGLDRLAAGLASFTP